MSQHMSIAKDERCPSCGKRMACFPDASWRCVNPNCDTAPEPPVEAPGKAREVDPGPMIRNSDLLLEVEKLTEHVEEYPLSDWKGACVAIRCRVNNMRTKLLVMERQARLLTPKASGEASEPSKSPSPNPIGEVVGNPTEGDAWDDRTARQYWTRRAKDAEKREKALEREVSRLREVEKAAKVLLMAYNKANEEETAFLLYDLEKAIAGVGAGDDPEKGRAEA